MDKTRINALNYSLAGPKRWRFGLEMNRTCTETVEILPINYVSEIWYTCIWIFYHCDRLKKLYIRGGGRRRLGRPVAGGGAGVPDPPPPVTRSQSVVLGYRAKNPSPAPRPRGSRPDLDTPPPGQSWLRAWLGDGSGTKKELYTKWIMCCGCVDIWTFYQCGWLHLHAIYTNCFSDANTETPWRHLHSVTL